ncbi:unnamed protein product [Sphenostylis stenocarpa]|uniref:Pentatricopeptide repeat-containing protein n=1 Tax=Sphenostylis stenocarpa TaxID=92480 RepID=A0AA86VCT6_9FABA|nr:unnamed protein product [Sphenostylis stenocarpa]
MLVTCPKVYQCDEWTLCDERLCDEQRACFKSWEISYSSEIHKRNFYMKRLWIEALLDDTIREIEAQCNVELDIAVLHAGLINKKAFEELIKACEALDLCLEMTGKGIRPNLATYTSLIHGLCDFSRWKEGSDLWLEMTGKGTQPNLFPYNSLCHGFHDARWKELQLGNVFRKGIMPDVQTFSVVADKFCSGGGGGP